MYIRLTFNASGDDFNAVKCMGDLVSQELNVIFEPNCPKHLSFVHHEEFSGEYYDEEYERAFYFL